MYTKDWRQNVGKAFYCTKISLNTDMIQKSSRSRRKVKIQPGPPNRHSYSSLFLQILYCKVGTWKFIVKKNERADDVTGCCSTAGRHAGKKKKKKKRRPAWFASWCLHHAARESMLQIWAVNLHGSFVPAAYGTILSHSLQHGADFSYVWTRRRDA